MKKIVLLPLDERPCNYDYTKGLLGDTDFTVVTPPKEILPRKKMDGDAKAMFDWVAAECEDSYGAIISIDALVYTGIISSRLHSLDTDAMTARLEKLRRLKKINPELKLYAFSLIMRCPSYSSSDEEPDYYEDFGREIFRHGYISHKAALNIATIEEQKELADIQRKLPQEFLDDYLSRRKKNIKINELAIDLTAEGVIDFLIIPQDDSSPYGFTARDQQLVRSHIASKQQQFNAYMYPDADAVESTLAARMVNFANGRRPLVYPKFSSAAGGTIIPPYEDRPIAESIKYQIMAAGGLVASSVAEADILLLLNTPAQKIGEAAVKGLLNTPDYAVNRTLLELVEYADYAITTLNKTVCFGDIGLANGGDNSLFELMRIKKLLFNIGGYAGWNTAANTLGTALPMSMIYDIYGRRQAHLDALALRYVEDIGYMANVRGYVSENCLSERGLNYFKVDGSRGEISEIITDMLADFAKEKLDDEYYEIRINDCWQPWSRMFETGLSVSVTKKKDKRIFVC